MVSTVGVVIPCYRARDFIKDVVNQILDAANQLQDKCKLKVYVVDDCCPEQSWKQVEGNISIKIIKHSRNLGVGAATISGFQAALSDNCQAVVKIDADGQHLPHYLIDLIPYLLSLPNYKLILVKGTRYLWPEITSNVPLIRRLGSMFLEPIARVALCYRRLTDIANGYLAFNALTLKHILSPNLGRKLESRYLFESSILERCSLLGCEVHEFAMASRYFEYTKSSMKSSHMVFPMLRFWIRAIIKRLFNQYIFSLNLGTILFLLSLSSFVFALRLFLGRIYAEISSGVLVSAGTSAAFTSSLTISLLSLCFFLFYDYSSGQNVKKVRFSSFINDLNELNLT
tara:strand:+ start:704 stop:1729 length:1026 start_codon:yes stop_codon:yes gene_type:complete